MNMEQSVPKRWHIKFRRRGITQKRARNKVSIGLVKLQLKRNSLTSLRA